MAQPPDPALPPESIIFGKFDGLKNVSSRERLGPSDLERALNVDIDDEGQAHLRRGFTLKAAGDYHSLWNFGALTYVVKNGDLGLLYPDYSHRVLKAGVGPNPLAYVEAGGDVYFSSETASGKIVGRSDSVVDWGEVGGAGTWVSPVVNPTSTLGQIKGKLSRRPPMATALAYYKGRIYLASDKLLWVTNLYRYSSVDATKGFVQFESPITVVGAVTDGIYVGTETNIYFLGGTWPLRRITVMNCGAARGSLVDVPAEDVKPLIMQTNKTASKNAVIFWTEYGVVAGFDAGDLYNLTAERYWFPDAKRVAPLYREMDGVTQYVGVADNGGGAADNARIGDYVEAEIRRFQGA